MCAIIFTFRLGLIPAHAGKTTATTSTALPPRAHPRSRGENHYFVECPLRSTGSSPLTRGKRNGRDGGSRRTGLIPAHAGKTGQEANLSYPPGAHPRSRGENRLKIFIGGEYRGSSPLTRGKPRKRGPCERQEGLIPAHAGKTETIDHATHSWRAHPRSRGENWPRDGSDCGCVGSSPLTRGKRGFRAVE